MVFGMSVFFPLISVLAMKLSGLLKTITLYEPEERIGPLIAAIVFYIWLLLNYRQFELGPDIFEANILGATLSLCLAFIINNFSKISLHAIGAGGLLGAAVLIRGTVHEEYYRISLGQSEIILSQNIYLIIIIIMAGLIGTSRLFLRAHKPSDVYGGYLVGFITQLLAYRIIAIF
jgi:membrane-associated phospholipid phosphatase